MITAYHWMEVLETLKTVSALSGVALPSDEAMAVAK